MRLTWNYNHPCLTPFYNSKKVTSLKNFPVESMRSKQRPQQVVRETLLVSEQTPRQAAQLVSSQELQDGEWVLLSVQE